MSQNNMGIDNNEETDDKVRRTKKRSFIEILIPVLTLITIVNCIVILVLVVNIGKKVNGLEQRLQTLQAASITVSSQSVLDSIDRKSVV